ncbi:MAG: ATP-dependent Clp protease proteolytic subunit [Tannerellaceae bacterium]|nr:ATP-dependent Clp protease proteolytic subunit [Tannerellaceae bacterium]
MRKRFFNMIAGADGQSCTMLLYGDIGEYEAVRSCDIVRELIEAGNQYGKIEARVNSNGGDVYSGIAIFNAFRTSKADITLYVDGIAASIAAVIVLCGKPVKMSRYARLMIHGVSGGCWGNKSALKGCLEEMEALENTLCTMLAEKTGKTEEDIRSMFFDEKDHWLTAEEALDLGIIDEIYDADPIPEDKTTPEQIYAHFINKYDSSLNNKNMIFEKLKQRPAFANCATEQDVLQHIDKLERDAAKVPDLEKEAAKVPDLEKEAAKVQTLTEQKTTLETELNTYKEKEKQETEAGYDQKVETAFQEGRITDPERPHFKALYRKDPETAESLISARPAKRRVMQNLHSPETPQAKGSFAEEMEKIRKATNQ